MPRDINKPNMLLDLDNTIICAEAYEEYDKKKYKKKEDLFRHDDMDGYYIVFSRPYLQEFLDYAFENFNVTVWTAASKDYALFIIENIILNKNPDRQLDFIFFTYHCDLSKKQMKWSKNLCMLWDIHNLSGYDKNNTIIIDDYISEVHKHQPNNCIISPAFEFIDKGSENDTFLKDILPELDKMILRIRDKETLPDGSINLATKVNENMKTIRTRTKTD